MSADLVEAIREKAEPTELPAGNPGLLINLTHIAAIALHYDMPGWMVERTALENGIIPKRYLRSMESITIKDQQHLLGSTIVQVGLGGLGGSLLEILLRTGIGKIYAADGDSFEETNLNRQALSTIHSIGSDKSAMAVKRAAELNPSVEFSAVTQYLDSTSLPAFVEGADIIVDALGGLKTRLALQHSAAEAHIPMVTGALAGWTGYVGVVQPGQTGPADIMGSDNAAEELLGCPAPAVSLFASLMACEIVNILTGHKSSLESSMLIVDLRSHTFEKVQL